MEFFDDGPEKPIRIWSRIVRRPILSGGNSNGDLPMLAFSDSSGRPTLRLLLLHDDARARVRLSRRAEDALVTAEKEQWTVVSMQNDWNLVFEPTGS
jgi:hypothetical protein